MPDHFSRFILRQESPGLIIALQTRPIAETIEELLLIAIASEAEEWVNRIVILPF